MIGLSCMIGGVIICLRRVSGATNWDVNLLGLHSRITDAAPGALLLIIGLMLVFITRFRVRTR